MAEDHTVGTWGPTVLGGSGGRRRLLRFAVAGVVAAAVAATVVPAALLLRLSAGIDRVDVGGLSPAAGGPLHLLVVGSDSRAGLTAEERRELTTGSAPGERADTMFVMTVAGRQAALLAFPRDLYVTLCDGSRGRLNTALAVGGHDCLTRSVSDLSGIPLAHLLVVDFVGFRRLVDAVGGVRICLERPLKDRDAGIDLPAGCQLLDGVDALGYVRVRKVDSDLERIKRQQGFLKALAAQVADPATVVNVPRLFAAAGAAGDALSADRGLGPLGLLRLGVGLRSLAGGSVATHTVPVRPAVVGGAAVLLPDEDEAPALFAAFRDGSVVGGAAAPAPGDVRVAVLNGTGVSGLASRTAEDLGAAGFVVVDVGNAPPAARTTVRHPPGERPAAEVVARALGGRVEVVEDADTRLVTVVIGPDRDG